MDWTYSPLPEDTIRVLDVTIYEGYSEPVCNFREVSLDDLPDYIAISYCWGDSTEVARLKFKNGLTLPISQTLLDLFNSSSKEHSTFTVWIDAICIDQKNLAERESQVLLMGRVYSSAKEVFLWLGDSDKITQRAFHFMENGRGDQADLESVLLLLGRPWFQRVWVIQEITVARNIRIGCGDDRIDFNRFSDCVFTVWNEFLGLGNYDDDDPAQRGLWCVTRVIHIRNDFHEDGGENEKEVSYEILLQAAFHCEATDKRDMVFAFRGIADKRPVPKPNYSISEEQVFTETAEALLCNGESLDLLVLCGVGNTERPPNLPTWAPNLRYHSYSEPLVPCDRAGWKAGGLLQRSPQIDTTPAHQLRLQVKRIDQVDVICPPFQSWSVAGQKAAVDAVWKLRLRLSEDISEEVWMDQMMSTLIFGIDIDDEPLEVNTPEWTEYREHFTEWFEWLRSSSTEEDLSKITHNKYHRTIGPRVDDEVAFMTSHGLLCIGTSAIAIGDVICTVPGCRIPLVLRPDTVTSDNGMRSPQAQTWILVGWCFAEGLMFGEAAALERPFEEIVLR